MKRDSNSYIFLYSIVMVVVVAVLLALVSSGLKPAQQENIKMEKRIDWASRSMVLDKLL